MDEPGTLIEDLQNFVRYRTEHLSGDEKGEAQVFLDRLFRAFGLIGVREAGATLEARIRKGAEQAVSFADLLFPPHCLIEMKKSGENLAKHYQQALSYWIYAVPNRPRYMILCNFDEFWIYDFQHQLDEPLERLTIVDLPRRWEALGFLRRDPIEPIFGNDLIAVTRDSADLMAQVFRSLLDRGRGRAEAQRFVLQSVMAAFAEDVGLLPGHALTRAVDDCLTGSDVYDLVFGLFREMNAAGTTAGGRFAGTPYFNGGLYGKIEPIALSDEELAHLRQALATDWSQVRPEIFGTLFEQSMDQDERHAFGAHFTSPIDIAKVVQPTIIEPFIDDLNACGTIPELEGLLGQLQTCRILDPACGAGNFLYIAYREMKRLEQKILAQIEGRRRGRRRGQAAFSYVSPDQFYGIDVNGFAVDLAKVTVLLAQKLAVDELDLADEQVLPLRNIDANFAADDALFRPWPSADVIIGNPPYLGRRLLIKERGAGYVAKLDEQFPEVDGVSDYVVYWFRLANDRLPIGGRAGLVGTNTVRQGHSRRASLDYILDAGSTIVEAVSTQPWSGEAGVSVSIVNWVKGPAPGPHLLWIADGELSVALDSIPASLSSEVDLRSAVSLAGNIAPKTCFQGQTAGAEGYIFSGFELEKSFAVSLMGIPPKVHPALGGRELLHEFDTIKWVADFDVADGPMARSDSLAVFEHLKKTVLPVRKKAADDQERQHEEALAFSPNARLNRHHAGFLSRWWQLSYRREEMLGAIANLDRYIAVPRTSSELRPTVFEFVDPEIRPMDSLVVFAHSDDYTFGILQSAIHRAWFQERCTTLETRLNYTNTTVWDCFAWPQDPSPHAVDAVVESVAEVLEARRVLRDAGVTLAQMYDSFREPGASALRAAHSELDGAVFAAYGFNKQDDILRRLLALNAETSSRSAAGLPVRRPGDHGLASSRSTHYKRLP